MSTPPNADHPLAHASVLSSEASCGIGSALALEMHRRDATLALSGRDVAHLAQVPVPGAHIERDLRTSGACADAVRGAVDQGPMPASASHAGIIGPSRRGARAPALSCVTGALASAGPLTGGKMRSAPTVRERATQHQGD